MIYFDNSATTYPKPPSVIFEIQRALKEYGFNPGRGGYRRSVATAEKLFNVRSLAKDFFNAESEEQVIFTSGCTEGLNIIIKGVLKKGDHVVISSMEHNSVVRPVHKLKREGLIDYSIAQVSASDNDETVNNFRKAINSKTRLIVCTHASNVTGIRLPVERLCALAHSYGVMFCMDAAQSAGLLDIDILNSGYDFVCCAGHKYLYGPMGTGLLILGNNMTIDTLTEGGTGSDSFSRDMPDFLPDRFEAGTQNVPGIIGLGSGIRFVQNHGLKIIYKKEKRLMDDLRSRLKNKKGLTVCSSNRVGDVPILSFFTEDRDSEEISRILGERYNIAVRGGLHCAPLAHKTIGTADRGTVRISPSVFTTDMDITMLANAIKKL